MSRFELLHRKIEMFFGKKYCNYKTRHGHNLEQLWSSGKGIERHIVYECSVCKQKFILDIMGLSKA